MPLRWKKKERDINNQAKSKTSLTRHSIESSWESKPQILISLNSDRWLYDQWVFKTRNLTKEDKNSQYFSLKHIYLCIFLMLEEECNFLRSMEPKPSNAEDYLVRYASTIFLNTITMWILYCHYHCKRSNNSNSNDQYSNISS